MMKEIPQLGLGTLYLQGEEVQHIVSLALDIGYVHIDTAQVYGNEQDIGAFLHGRDRNALWITTKIDFKNYHRLEESFQESLERLQMDYVDLLLLHRPTTLEEHERCLDVVMKLQEAGKVNHFGVSNFTLAQLEHAWNYTGGRIFTNQIEYHPCLSQERIKGFCDEKGIKITAYSPLGQGNLLKNQILQSLADKHGVSVAQVCIAWLLQQGCVVIPKASSKERLQENFDAQKLVLDEEDLKIIAQLPKDHRYVNPPFAQWDR